MKSGVKFDQEKPRMALLSPEGLLEEAKGMTYGAAKYGDYNWRGGIAATRYLSAAMRHIIAYTSGETVDPESGVNHLGLAKCNLGMCLQTIKDSPGLDDRFKKEKR